MSGLSRLASYIDVIGKKEEKLLFMTASHIQDDMDCSDFISELYRLAEINPSLISDILTKLLNSYLPHYDSNDNFKLLLGKLAELGLKNKALVFADSLRHLQGMQDLFENLTNRTS